MSITSRERQLLAETFEETGPDAPTLCAGWTTRDLLAHLLVRERRADAAPGIAIPMFAKRTRAVQEQYAERPYADLIETFRGGAPMWSLFGWPIIGDIANLFEFFVHLEDVRRASEHWEPRPEDPALEEAMHSRLRYGGRLFFRASPVGVVVRSAGRPDMVVRRRPASVVLVGQPSEVALLAAGRPPEKARVVVQGEPEDVEAFLASPRGL